MQHCSWHCCKTRWIAILRLLPRMFKPINNLICCKACLMWVVKRATSLSNSFCSNVAKQVALFLLPVFLYLWERTYGTRVAVHWPRTFDRPHQAVANSKKKPPKTFETTKVPLKHLNRKKVFRAAPNQPNRPVQHRENQTRTATNASVTLQQITTGYCAVWNVTRLHPLTPHGLGGRDVWYFSLDIVFLSIQRKSNTCAWEIIYRLSQG